MAVHRIFRALVDCEGLIAGGGHVCGAKRGKTCPIPPALEDEALKYMVPIDEDGAEDHTQGGIQGEAPIGNTAPPPDKLEERELKILEALRAIAVRNSPDDFVNDGSVPKVPKVAKEAGMRVYSDEVGTLWKKLQEELVEQA